MFPSDPIRKSNERGGLFPGFPAVSKKPKGCVFPPENPRFRSAKEILDAGYSTGDGVYTIYPDMRTSIQAYCDMTTDGGGWTAFFSGQNGSVNKFADFEGTVSVWYNSEKYLRRIPAEITTGNWFMASIETLGKRAKFKISVASLALFKAGTQGSWQTNTDVTTLTGTINYSPNYFWTGVPGNNSFIFDDNQAAPSFMSSYNVNTGWNQCDGVSDTTSLIRLFYR